MHSSRPLTFPCKFLQAIKMADPLTSLIIRCGQQHKLNGSCFSDCCLCKRRVTFIILFLLGTGGWEIIQGEPLLLQEPRTYPACAGIP